MRCPNCEQLTGAPDWKAHTHTMWANQHGSCTRIFCDSCGYWHNVTDIYPKPLKVEIVKRPDRK